MLESQLSPGVIQALALVMIAYPPATTCLLADGSRCRSVRRRVHCPVLVRVLGLLAAASGLVLLPLAPHYVGDEIFSRTWLVLMALSLFGSGTRWWYSSLERATPPASPSTSASRPS